MSVPAGQGNGFVSNFADSEPPENRLAYMEYAPQGAIHHDACDRSRCSSAAICTKWPADPKSCFFRGFVGITGSLFPRSFRSVKYRTPLIQFIPQGNSDGIKEVLNSMLDNLFRSILFEQRQSRHSRPQSKRHRGSRAPPTHRSRQ